MIKSMTGYGKAEVNLSSGTITIEIRTLNGKSADINLKTSIFPKDKEILVRQKIADSLVRGTIDVYANYVPNESAATKKINQDVVLSYFSQIEELNTKLGIAQENKPEILAAILKFPDVTDAKKDDLITEDNWLEVDAGIDKALALVNDYRAKEGVSLYKDVTSRVQNILNYENEVEGFEKERIDTVKEKLLKALDELKQQPDQSRFEQEMIFYLEKLDINEEKVRLRQHCKYFMETIDSEPYPGKKLGFIIQEMGREINTTGSKANHAGIQKLVVHMKDELEKIREQSMNIL
jgi:uncharacterized protein (TIGR00255 family)